MGTNITRRDEKKFLKLKIAENCVFSEPLNFDEIIDFILKGKLPLQVSDDDGTKVIDDKQFEQIKETMQHLLKIIAKPKSFIKSLEEKVPVDTAKRISHKAISRLSQDSNDWYARTILAVKPKNIVADVNEETIDLYENRFICRLTDRISKLVAARRHYYQNLKETIEKTNAIRVIGKYYTTESFQFFNKITKNSVYYQEDNSFIGKINDELDEIEKVEKKIRIIKRSEFYRLLHKKKRDAIHKTNILMFDTRYNRAYKLWEYLNQTHEEECLEDDIEGSEDEFNAYYSLYCMLCVFSALHDIGFTEKSKNRIQYSDNEIKLNGELLFVNGNKTLKVWVSKREIHLCYNYDIKRGKWDEFVFCSDFKNFEELNGGQINEFTEGLLNKLVVTERLSYISGRYAFVSFNNMRNCAENTALEDKVYRRFYGMGSNFSSDEKLENLEKWSDYKTGIAIITPADLRSNFLRIERIINYHLIKHTDLSAGITHCPLCGGEHIVTSGNQNYSCHDCKHNISITYCNNCDPQKKKPIIWVKYIDDKFLQRDDVVSGNFASKPIFDKIDTIENIMGEKSTTSFELIKDTTSWKLKTICPHCGVRLGDSAAHNA